MAGGVNAISVAGAVGVGKEPTGGGVDPADVAASLQALRDSGDYQLDFPPVPPPPTPEPSDPPADWLVGLMQWLAGLAEAFGPVATGLFWLLVAAALLTALYFLVPTLRQWVDAARARWRQRAGGPPTADGWQPDAAVARNLLAEADALAGAGQFAEAAHLLLYRSLDDIRARRPGLLRPALTARGIAAANALPATARAAFGELAATVEFGLFARRPVGADQWQSARDAYARFALPQQWVRPA